MSVAPARSAPVAPASGARGLGYQPALDGLRGVAVLAVVAFHLGHLRGGFLGVDLFFTLSGYLITTLLLTERARYGRIDLRAFWIRRARRLLPALGLLLAVLAVYAAVWARPDELAGIRGPGLAALAYVANWWFILTGNGYWDLFTSPSPLEHLWSLSIEEQFYLLWPLAVVVVLRRSRVGLGGVAAALAVVSAVLMAVVAGSGGDLSRAYLGTFTRAGSILVGAGLAARLHARPLATRAQRALGPAALAAAAGLVWAWATVDGAVDVALYRGGFLLHALAVAVVIAAVVDRPDRVLTRFLGLWPLRAAGTVSYGLYLWHWPVFVILDADRTGFHGWPLLALRLGVTVALTVVSFVAIEQPVRRGALSRHSGPVLLVATPVVLAVALVAATVPPETAVVVGPAPTTSAAPAPTTSAPPSPGTAPTTAPTTVPSPPPVLSVVAPAGLPAVRPVSAADPLRVVLVGDSYLYDVEPGVAAALEATGVATVAQEARLGFTITAEGWDQTLREIVAAHHPDLVVAMWARFDAAWRERNDPAAYDQRLDEAMAILTGSGAAVAFVGLAPSLTAGIDPVPVDRSINTVFAGLPARFPGAVVYVDPDPVVAPTGRPDRWLDTPAGRLLVRKTDVSHFCGDGAARFGLAIGELVAELTATTPADPAAWWAGTWRADPRYDDPRGACSAG